MQYISDFKSGVSVLDSYDGDIFAKIESDAIMVGSDDILGVGLDQCAHEWFAVKHNKKSALLYQYILDAYTEVGVECGTLAGCSIISYPEREFRKGLSNTLSVNMAGQVLSLSGFKGSVAAWKDKSLYGYDTVYSLYDCLVMLCRYFKHNLMQYRCVQFTSDRLQWCTYVEFAQTTEARRFFLKMFMESVGNAVH